MISQDDDCMFVISCYCLLHFQGISYHSKSFYFYFSSLCCVSCQALAKHLAQQAAHRRESQEKVGSYSHV